MADKTDKTKRPGWAEERTPKDEPHAPTLTNIGAIQDWVAKAAKQSGPRVAPGTKSS